MDKANRTTIAVCVILLTMGMLVSLPASAQPPRPQNAPDISGEWNLTNNEDPGQIGASGQPPLGDYLGIPFNDAGRMRSDTTAESIWGTPEYQCRPHSAPHQWRGLGGARILKEQDPLTRDVKAYHVQFMLSLDRPIYMDGRPHPPAYAPHSWSGFSTGEWIGSTLKVTTTHLKDGYLKRGGPQTSDMLKITEFITRHDDILTIVTMTEDPIYMDEPYVQSTTYLSDLNSHTATEECDSSAFAQNGGTDRHHVPHFLPGQNTALTEWLKAEDWVPAEPARGGVKTLYPEYRATLNGGVSVANLKVPSSRASFAADKSIAEQSPHDGEVHVLPVQGNIYMLVADGTNIAVSVGEDGITLVNSGPAQMTDKLLAAINQLASSVVAATTTNKCFGTHCPGTWGWSSPYMDQVISSPAPPKPIRYLINTSVAPEHTGGNEKIAAAVAASRGRLSIYASENVLNRMSAPAGKQAPTSERAWPTDTYFDEFQKLPQHVNGEPVIIYREAAANTDGDSIAFFRRSDVIAAGNIFSTVAYPIIDIEKGGSIHGVIGGLNHILDLAVPEYRSQGGTWVIPSHGRLSDTADVASYRNMLVMIRDRVQDMMKKGMTLDQVKAAHPTMDFDGRYGSTTGPWTTDMFVEAVYKSLQEKK
jgi:glyoxylase-like metal-dependent hydrolase (beta-lactamase superfamily II)